MQLDWAVFVVGQRSTKVSLSYVSTIAHFFRQATTKGKARRRLVLMIWNRYGAQAVLPNNLLQGKPAVSVCVFWTDNIIEIYSFRRY